MFANASYGIASISSLRIRRRSSEIGTHREYLVGIEPVDRLDLSTNQFRGCNTLILFWNSECGICPRLPPPIHAWEANPPAYAPQMLVVSQGSVDANRQLGFHAPVLQTDGGAGFPFGILGTPSAIMIDADGMIASPAATGASWLGLLNSRADHSLERETREVRRPQDMITQEYDAMLPMAIHERVMRHQGARRERFTRGYQGR